MSVMMMRRLSKGREERPPFIEPFLEIDDSRMLSRNFARALMGY
jgi:hypothetical protein